MSGEGSKTLVRADRRRTLLTPQEQNAADLLLKGESQTDAYLTAGYAPEADRAEASKMASDFFHRAKIMAYIAKVMARASEIAAVTRASLTEELEEARKLAIAALQAGPAVSATMGKAKLHGLDVNKHEIGGPGGEPLKPAVEIHIVDHRPADAVLAKDVPE